MPSKDLKLRLLLDTSNFEAKIKRSTKQVEQYSHSLNKQIASETRLFNRTQDRLTILQRHNQALTKTEQSVARVSKAQYEAWWREQLQTQELLKKEKIRQQSLRTITEADRAAQRMARSEYEAWWAAQLTRKEWEKAHPVLNKLSTTWNRIDSKIRSTISGNSRISGTYNQIVSKVKSWASAHTQVENSAKRVNNQYKQSASLLDTLRGKVVRLASAYLGVLAARALFTTSDNITASENRLNNANANILGDDPSDGYSNATIKATEESMNKMYAASQRARTGYSEMMANVSKSMVLAGKAFGNNMDNAIAFQETMAKAYTVGGASAAEQASSMYQMIQALGSGILQGDELRSVREGAPLAYKAIEEFAQGVYNTEESLKDLASQGKITSDIVVAAMANASEGIDAAFEASAMTWAQAWTHIKNVATDAVRPIQDTLTEFIGSDAAQMVLVGLENIIRFVGAAINVIITMITKLITWFADNWDWVKYIVYAGLIALSIVFIKLGLIAITTGIRMVISILSIIGPIGLVILAIGVVLAILAALGIRVQDVVGFIVGIVFAAITLISSTVQNVFTFIFNLLSGLWEYVKAVATNIGIVFVNCWNSAKSAFWSFIADCLDGLKRLEPVINAVAQAFGAEGFTLSGLSNNLRSKADSYTHREYVDTGDAFKNGFNRFEYQDIIGNTKDAYEYGFNLGAGGVNWIGDKLSNFSNKFKGKYGSDALDKLDPNLGLNTTTPNSDALGNISDNTDKIADSVELAEEDLEWLRKLAQLEWKKEYTNNQISINMTNNNNVNSDSDLDGIVTKLADKLYEELSVTASGVYA